MKTFLKTFLSDQSGASAAEYALILSIVGVAIAGAALYLAAQVSGGVTNAGNTIASNCPGNDCNAVKQLGTK